MLKLKLKNYLAILAVMLPAAGTGMCMAGLIAEKLKMPAQMQYVTHDEQTRNIERLATIETNQLWMRTEMERVQHQMWWIIGVLLGTSTLSGLHFRNQVRMRSTLHNMANFLTSIQGEDDRCPPLCPYKQKVPGAKIEP